MIDTIIKLSETYSNDLEFGSKVRELINKSNKDTYSMYGTPMSETCHKGYECGLTGLYLVRVQIVHIPDYELLI